MGDRGLPARVLAAWSRRCWRRASGSSECRRTGWARRVRASASQGSPIRSTRSRSPERSSGDGVEKFPVAFLDERAMEIRLLLDHRNDLVAERTRTVNRLRWHLLELCPELEASLGRGALNQARVLDRVDRRLRKLHASARTRIAREQISDLRALTRAIEQLAADLGKLVTAHRPALLAEQGCGPLTAAILIGRTAGNQQFRTQAGVRAPHRDRADTLLLGQTHPTPTRPRRRPPTQPRTAHHRRHPRAVRPSHQAIPRAKTSRRQDHQGRLAFPQTPPRQALPPAALPAARRPAASHRTTTRQPQSTRNPSPSTSTTRSTAKRRASQPNDLCQLVRPSHTRPKPRK